MLQKRSHQIGIGCSFLLIGLTVLLGAVGSHIVELHYAENSRGFNTGVYYAQLHGAGLAGLFIIAHKIHPLILKSVVGCFIAGLAGFSGSLIIKTFGWLVWPGFMIPLGGISFILGWIILGVCILYHGVVYKPDTQ